MIRALVFLAWCVFTVVGGISLGLAFLFVERKVGAWRRGRR